MQGRSKWAAIAGTLLISGALLTGTAFAVGDKAPSAAPEAKVPKVETKELTPGEKELLGKLRDLRKTYLEKYRAEAQGLIDQARKDGKITQEQADRFKRFGSHMRGHGKEISQEQLKAKLNEAVKAGRISQEKANEIMKRWQEHHNR